MTVDEISSLVAQRLLQGAMNHEQFANYYSFLGLEGYKLFHTYHFLDETLEYINFIDYYIGTYNKLIPHFAIETLSSISIIPQNWYSHMREDTDVNTKRNAIKNGLEKYVKWERDTKKFLEDVAIQAINVGELCLGEKIKECLKSVDKEIKLAEKEWLEIKSTDYNLSTVVEKQGYLCKKYTKKLQQTRMRKEIEHDKSQRS